MEWRTIEEFSDYEISSAGDIRKGNDIKKPFIDCFGYNAVNLNHNGKRTCARIHRLVAKTFIENRYNKTQVDHINRNKLDNRIENLRWLTHEENAINREANKNNKLGYKNICWNEKRNEWRLQISRKGKVVFRAEYKDLDDAILNREEVVSRFQIIKSTD
jgi:hypothetical protein